MTTSALSSIFNYIWDRLGCADEHFEAIKGHLRTYYRRCADGVSGEFDPKGQHGTMFVSPGYVAPEIRMHTLVGEFLHDMRSSLDHLAWQMVEENGGLPTDETTFPIPRVGPTPNQHGVQGPPHVPGGVSATALALIEDAQPYKWGATYMRHPLYVLHELWNVDKHRHIVSRGSRLDEFVIPAGTPAFTFTLHVDAVTEDGAEISLVPDDVAVNVNAKTTMRVMIDEPSKQIVAKPLFEALKEVREAVFTTIMQAEDRCF